jgi:hypothetical protein
VPEDVEREVLDTAVGCGALVLILAPGRLVRGGYTGHPALGRILCHNVCCTISAWHDPGIDPAPWVAKAGPAADDEPRDVLKFPGR